MNVFASNSREQRRLEGQLKSLSSSTKYEMNKIDQEMMLLKKQLVENQKVFGTRCDLRRSNYGGSRKSHITITKVITTSARTDRPGTFPGRSGRRHSVASPLGLNESDYYNDGDKGFSSTQNGCFYSAKNRNSQRNGTSTLPFSANEQRLRNHQGSSPREVKQASSPRISYRQQRRHSITSTEDGLERSTLHSGNTQPTYGKIYSAYGDGILDDSVRAERSGSTFSLRNNENRKQSNQFNNRDSKQSSRHFSATARRSVVRKPSFTLIFNEDEVNEGAYVKTQRNAPASNDKLTAMFKDAHSPDIGVNKRLFQRRHSLPNTALIPPKPNEQLHKTNSREKLTAKLPARISSARTRLTSTPQTNFKLKRRPTPVEESNEAVEDDVFEKEDDKNDDVDDNDNDHEEDDGESENKNEQQPEESSGDDQPPQELRDLPKITLEEKMQKFFADSVDNFPDTPGHFQAVLDQFNNNAIDNDEEAKKSTS